MMQKTQEVIFPPSFHLCSNSGQSNRIKESHLIKHLLIHFFKTFISPADRCLFSFKTDPSSVPRRVVVPFEEESRRPFKNFRRTDNELRHPFL